MFVQVESGLQPGLGLTGWLNPPTKFSCIIIVDKKKVMLIYVSCENSLNELLTTRYLDCELFLHGSVDSH